MGKALFLPDLAWDPGACGNAALFTDAPVATSPPGMGASGGGRSVLPGVDGDADAGGEAELDSVVVSEVIPMAPAFAVIAKVIAPMPRKASEALRQERGLSMADPSCYENAAGDSGA